MSTIVTFILIGLGAGAAYAGISLGIVVTYKGTGVINFAAGAMAAWGAFVFDELRRKGVLWLPIPVNHVSQLGAVPTGGSRWSRSRSHQPCCWLCSSTRSSCDRSGVGKPRIAHVVSRVGLAAAVAWGIYVFIHLRTTGRYLLPVLPYRFDVGGVSFSLALGSDLGARSAARSRDPRPDLPTSALGASACLCRRFDRSDEHAGGTDGAAIRHRRSYGPGDLSR